MKTGAEMRLWREKIDVSQERVAYEIDISQPTLSEWENGKNEKPIPKFKMEAWVAVLRKYDKSSVVEDPMPHGHPCHELCLELQDRWMTTNEVGRRTLRDLLLPLCIRTAPALIKYWESLREEQPEKNMLKPTGT